MNYRASVKPAVFLIGLILIFFGFSILQDVYWRQPAADAAEIAFEIESGKVVNEISAALEEAGLIGNRFVFETYVWLLGKEGEFRAGRYALRPGQNYASLVKTLTEFGYAQGITITVPEGYTIVQIGRLLEEKLGLTEADWLAAVGPTLPLALSSSLLADKPGTVDLEGYLFPDTYEFAADASAVEVAEEMLKTLEIRFKENWDVLNYAANVHELLTVASIVEREVSGSRDRGLAADIFWRRLAAGIPLQADSTVNYATGKNSSAVSFEDLRIDSPYNTYKYPGLPPGPISNPGMDSIIATANPEPNDFWFFLTTPSGEAVYAKTYEEHLRNKAAYLQ